MKAYLTKKNILLTLLLLLALKVIITILTNISGRDTDNERTEKYLQSVQASQDENIQEKLPNIIFILTDEVYAKLVYEKTFHSPAYYDKCRERTIILNSLSNQSIHINSDNQQEYKFNSFIPDFQINFIIS